MSVGKVPPSTGRSGLMSSLYATLAAEMVCAIPQFTGPVVAAEDPARSIVILSPATSTRTFTTTGSSPIPSLSRLPSAA